MTRLVLVSAIAAMIPANGSACAPPADVTGHSAPDGLRVIVRTGRTQAHRRARNDRSLPPSLLPQPP
jgi:hypothetical protein